MDWKLKAKKHLSFKESSEIESLCQKLKPYEWKEVITTWRDRLAECKNRDEIITSYRDIASEIINARIERELQMIKEAEEPPQVDEGGITLKILDRIQDFSKLQQAEISRSQNYLY
uniref:Uncharacterized protein n=1 Tax=Panagrolaimus superbus TaxID=310955 RepID=A0A914YXL0_9BILA